MYSPPTLPDDFMTAIANILPTPRPRVRPQWDGQMPAVIRERMLALLPHVDPTLIEALDTGIRQGIAELLTNEQRRAA